MTFRICLWRAFFFSKFKKNLVDFSPSSYHVHLLLTFAPSTNFLYISSSSDLILLYFWTLRICLNRFQDLLTYFQGHFFFPIIFSAYFGIWYREFSDLELHIPPFHLAIKRISSVQIVFQVFNKMFKSLCEIFITD